MHVFRRGAIFARHDRFMAVDHLLERGVAELLTGSISDFDAHKLAQVLSEKNLHHTIGDTSSGLTTVGFHNDTTAVHIFISDGVGHCRRSEIATDGLMDAQDASGTTTSNGDTHAQQNHPIPAGKQQT